jgi:hypothetical protein
VLPAVEVAVADEACAVESARPQRWLRKQAVPIGLEFAGTLELFHRATMPHLIQIKIENSFTAKRSSLRAWAVAHHAATPMGVRPFC